MADTTRNSKNEKQENEKSKSGKTMHQKPWIKTPLIESAALSKAAGCRVLMKLENLQPAGSFKSRNIGNLLVGAIEKHHEAASASASQSNLHFYSSSGGNAGLACVTAATSLGYPSTVIVPHSTKPLMIAKIRTAGATDVIQHGESWAEADRYLREKILGLSESSREEGKGGGGVYVPPFDHPDIWEGGATLVDELVEQMEVEKGLGSPEAIICSVGGGGLFCGIMKGLERERTRAVWFGDGDKNKNEDENKDQSQRKLNPPKQVHVLACETAGAESLHLALKTGELITLPRIDSAATSLGAKRVANQAFEYGQRENVTSVVLSDAEAAMGAWRFADDERMLVEMSCGVCVALCYDARRLKSYLPALTKDSVIVLVVCGGTNVTLEMLAAYRERYGNVEKGVGVEGDRSVPSSLTAP